MAWGSVEPLKRLHARFGTRVRFIDVLVRRAHPGPDAPAYRSGDGKRADAEAYQQEEEIPWPVVVDDVDGSVHLAYGGLATPTYLIGTAGRVAFHAPTTGTPTLARAPSELDARGGRGIVGGGVDPVPHLLPPLTEGWPALVRGRTQSLQDLRTALPGSVALLRLGRAIRPLSGSATILLHSVAYVGRPANRDLRTAIPMEAGRA